MQKIAITEPEVKRKEQSLKATELELNCRFIYY